MVRIFAVVLAAMALSCSDAPTEPPPVPVPATLEIVSGNEQEGVAGSSVPDSLVVQVRDQNGQPLGQSRVEWDALHGQTHPSSTLADHEGRARTAWTLGTTAGPQKVTARVGSLERSFAAEAHAGAVARLELEPSRVAFDRLGDTARIHVTGFDSHGNVALVRVAWRSSDRYVASVDSAGLVTTWGYGTATLHATAGTVEASVDVVIEATPDRVDRIFFAILSPEEEYGLYVIRADGGDLRRLTDLTDGFLEWDWDVSPDGTRIALTLWPDGYTRRVLYWMFVDTPLPRQFFDWRPWPRPRWSPDGREIAFQGHIDGSLRVHTPATGETERIVVDEVSIATSGGPAWRPDGQQLAWCSFVGSKACQIHVVDRDGGNRRQLTHDEFNLSHSPLYAPDGSGLLYTWAGELVLDPLDGSDAQVLFRGNGGGGDSGVQWHPEGNRILFDNGGISVYDFSTGSVHVLLDDYYARGPRWSPTADRVAYVVRPGGNAEPGLWVRHSATGESVRIYGHPDLERYVRWQPRQDR